MYQIGCFLLGSRRPGLCLGQCRCAPVAVCPGGGSGLFGSHSGPLAPLRKGLQELLWGHPPPLPFAPETTTAGAWTGPAEAALSVVSRRGGLWQGPGMRSAYRRCSGLPCWPLLRPGPALPLQSRPSTGLPIPESTDPRCPECCPGAPETSLDAWPSADSGTSRQLLVFCC